MGYSKSLETLKQMEPALSLLVQGQPCEWHRPAGDADRFAYRIREALHIASRHFARAPHDNWLEPIATAQKLFTIQVISAQLVRAVYANATDIQLEPTASTQALQPGPSHNISQIRSLEDLMSAWHKAMPTNDKLHFPDAQLSETEMQLAGQWAASLMPPWMILRPQGTNSLTLAPDDPRVPNAAKVGGGVLRSISSDISTGAKSTTVAAEPPKISLKSKPLP